MFSVIIPSFNGLKWLKLCLVSVKHSFNPFFARFPEKFPTEIIIVDNGSTDGSKEYLQKLQSRLWRTNNKSQANSKLQNTNQKEKPNIKVIFNKDNLGFAKAANQGADAATKEFLLVLNNDVRLDRNFFLEMTTAISKKRFGKVGSFGSIVLNFSGHKVESCGLCYQLSGKAENIGNHQKYSHSKYNQEKLVFGFNGAAVLYRREAFFSAGGFDESFFAYEEDVDLSLRLQTKGWQALFVPQAIAYHAGGQTSRTFSQLREKQDWLNWWRIIIKNYPIGIIIHFLFPILRERAANFYCLIRNAHGWRKITQATWAIKSLFPLIVETVKKRSPLSVNVLSYIDEAFSTNS